MDAVMKYAIHYRPVCAVLLPAGWHDIGPAPLEYFPWNEGNGQPQVPSTKTKLAWTDDALHIRFSCEDRHIVSRVTHHNGPVWTDSCVELFMNSAPERTDKYWNIEVNACGFMRVEYGASRKNRAIAEINLISKITAVSSIKGISKKASENDTAWEMLITVPFDAIRELTGLESRPEKGTIWRGNLYRCGPLPQPWHACWTPVTAPHPDFHRPECFGEFVFG